MYCWYFLVYIWFNRTTAILKCFIFGADLVFSLQLSTGETGYLCHPNCFHLFRFIQSFHSECNKCPHISIGLDKGPSGEKNKKSLNAIIFPLVPDRIRETCAGLFNKLYSYSAVIIVYFTHSVCSSSPLFISIHIFSPRSLGCYFEINTKKVSALYFKPAP